MQIDLSSSKRLFIGTSLVLLFLIPALAACGSVSNGTHAVGTPGAPVETLSTQSVSPRVSSGVQPCPGDTGDPTHWMHIISTNIDNEHVESVSCANIMGTPSLQALVTDRRSDAGNTLDVYVFNNINAASPAQIFHTFGLVKGQAKISGYNTILTAQADVNQGHQPWKLSATMVSGALAAGLLNWSPSSTTTLLSGGGAHDVSAVVRVRSTEIVSGVIDVTLSRLEGNTNGGIWEVVSVTANGMSLTSPTAHAVLSNPSNVKGTGSAFEGVIGQVMVLDHLYNTIGKTSAIGVVGNGPTSFSTSLSYQSTFPAGIQEGLLVLYAPSNANGSIAAAVMEKILVNGALERTFAVERYA